MQGMAGLGFGGEQPASHVTQSGPAHDPFRGDPGQVQVVGNPLPQLPFPLASGSEFAMGPLTGHGHQPTGARDAIGHPKARSGSDDQ